MRLLTLRTVLVATDLDLSSSAALRTAGALAQAAGASLHVVHALASTDGPGDDRTAGSPGSLGNRLRSAGMLEAAAQFHEVPGAPATVIRAVADSVDADVIVLGPHRENRAVVDPLGSTAYGVVTGVAVPCLVAASPLRLPVERVLVAADLSATARGALVIALSWASALRGGSAREPRTRLTVLHVQNAAGDAGGMPERSSLEHELAFLRSTGGSWAGVAVEGVTVASTDPARTIADHAADHDLVVAGTRGLGVDDAARLGSVSSALIDLLDVPVLLVPPAVWQLYAAGPAVSGV
jgi:nucleotide-binding universal stress UspA family protein